MTTSSLQAYYSFDASDSTDDHSTLDGSDTSMSYVSGKLSNCASFNGSSSVIDLPTALLTGTTGSIGFWIHAPTASANDIFISAGYESNDNYYLLIRLNRSNEIQLQQNDNGTPNVIYGDSVIGDDVWTHVVVTSSGTAYKIYVNGSADGLTVSSGTNNGDWFDDTSNINSMVLGLLRRTIDEAHLNGELDEVGFWNDELSSSEVSDLYNGGSGLAYPFTSGIGLQVNIGDVWKEVTAAQINIGDVWKAVAGIQINIGDVWKTVL